MRVTFKSESKDVTLTMSRPGFGWLVQLLNPILGCLSPLLKPVCLSNPGLG